MLPKQRQTRTRGKKRRSHDAIGPRHITSCPNCRSPRIPHAACSECGYVRPGLTLNFDKES